MAAPSREGSSIVRARVRRIAWRDTPLAYFLVAVVPCIAVLPLRFFLFPDGTPATLVLLGPALEEGLKTAGLLLALMAAALLLPRGRDPENVFRYWLFAAPWVVGGVYGLLEGLLVYPADSHLNFTLRWLAHGTFTALGLATLLWVWRMADRPYAGVALGFGVAWSAHILFNAIALLSRITFVTFTDQALYGLGVFAVALVALLREVGHEPASPEAASFLALPPRRLRT